MYVCMFVCYYLVQIRVYTYNNDGKTVLYALKLLDTTFWGS